MKNKKEITTVVAGVAEGVKVTSAVAVAAGFVAKAGKKYLTTSTAICIAAVLVEEVFDYISENIKDADKEVIDDVIDEFDDDFDDDFDEDFYDDEDDKEEEKASVIEAIIEEASSSDTEDEAASASEE